jgi:acyl-coenzyme A thioesterase PaaI-like protein
MSSSLCLLKKIKRLPLGLWFFSRAICFIAPYFGSIRPTFIELQPGYGVAKFKKRRSVQNHLGTVHAIAMANLCELVAGTTLELTLPATHRWIPRSMKINYLAKATTDVIAKTRISLGDLPLVAGSEIVHVDVYDLANKLVVTADIEMYVSAKKPAIPKYAKNTISIRFHLRFQYDFIYDFIYGKIWEINGSGR